MISIVVRIAGAVLLTGAMTFHGVHGETVDQMAEQLINLRSEVETLHGELDEKKAEYKQAMTTLAMQSSDLEVRLRQEELRLKELGLQLDRNRELAREAGVDNEHLKPVVLNAIADLKRHIPDRLPFKQKERLAALEEIEAGLVSGAIPPHRAANRLWSFYEDEVRMTGESGLYRQTIAVEGREVLADVARIGMVMMFFATHDEKYGAVVRDGALWRYDVIREPEQRDRIEHLFASLKKQIRTGYFELPPALVATEEAR